MRRPNLFIVGAPRCGTTAIHRYLGAHPQIFMSKTKEPHFFGADLNFQSGGGVRDRAAYMALFAAARDAAWLGEASAFYLYSETAAEEIADFSPASKIIIMLRNPVDMIYSLHSHLLYLGQEPITDFAAALDAEPERLSGAAMPASADLTRALFYRDLAGYAARVEHYLAVFGPDRVLPVLFDDFTGATADEYRRVLRFLDVDDDFAPAFERVNDNKAAKVAVLNVPPKTALGLAKKILPRTLRDSLKRTIKRHNTVRFDRPPMDQALRRHLQAEFAGDIARLAKLLNRNLDPWTAPSA